MCCTETMWLHTQSQLTLCNIKCVCMLCVCRICVAWIDVCCCMCMRWLWSNTHTHIWCTHIALVMLQCHNIRHMNTNTQCAACIGVACFKVTVCCWFVKHMSNCASCLRLNVSDDVVAWIGTVSANRLICFNTWQLVLQTHILVYVLKVLCVVWVMRYMCLY